MQPACILYCSVNKITNRFKIYSAISSLLSTRSIILFDCPTLDTNALNALHTYMQYTHIWYIQYMLCYYYFTVYLLIYIYMWPHIHVLNCTTHVQYHFTTSGKKMNRNVNKTTAVVLPWPLAKHASRIAQMRMRSKMPIAKMHNDY